VQAKWFGSYDDPPLTGTMIQSWDTAIKTTVRSDWSVGITARYYMGRWYILDVFRKRVEFGDLMRALCGACREHRIDRLLIEDASSGQALIQQLRQDAPEGVVLPIAITPTIDKIARFEAIASRIEAGMVVLPRSAPWLADFIGELVKFPGGAHDDQADALAQMLANPPPSSPVINAGPELIGPDDYGATLEPGYDPWGPSV
jgi:predicted phage terminase large subunit-like protein